MDDLNQWLQKYKTLVSSLEDLLQWPVGRSESFPPDYKAQMLILMKGLVLKCVGTVTAHSYAVVRVEVMMTPNCTETLSSHITNLADLIDTYRCASSVTQVKSEQPDKVITEDIMTDDSLDNCCTFGADNIADSKDSYMKQDNDSSFFIESTQFGQSSDPTLEISLPVVNHNDTIQDVESFETKEMAGLNVCPHCGKAIKAKRNYLYHLYRAHNVRSRDLKLFKCPHKGCDYAAPSPPMIERHVRTHKQGFRRNILDESWIEESNIEELTGSLSYNKFSCFMCTYSVMFFSREEINEHMIKKHVEGTADSQVLQCIHCDKQFSLTKPPDDKFDIESTSYALIVHLVKDHAWRLPKFIKTYSCPNETCTFVGLQSKDIDNHLEHKQCGDVAIEVSEGDLDDCDDGNDEDDIHNCDDDPDDDLSSSGMYKCKHCSKEIKVKKNYMYHLYRVHNVALRELSLIPCPHKGCKYQAPTSHMISRHVKHHNKPRYYTRKHSYAAAKQVLTYKKYGCVLCGNDSEFQDMDTLRKHFTESHVTREEDGQDIIQCVKCSKKISSKTDGGEFDIDTHCYLLVKHLRTHEWELPDYIETFPCAEKHCSFIGLDCRELNQHRNLVHDEVKVQLESSKFHLKNNVSEGSVERVNDKTDNKSSAKAEGKLTVKRTKVMKGRVTKVKLAASVHGKYYCQMCGLQMSTRKNYTYHLFKKHQVLVKGMTLYNCPKCDYSAPNTHMLKRHVKTHGRLEKLEDYLTGESLLQGPAVEGQSVVRPQAQRETDPMKYTHNMFLLRFKCYMCDSVDDFATRELLDAHFKRVHTQMDSGRMKAKCPHCTTSFPFKTPKRLNPRALNIMTRLIQKAYYKLLKHLVYKHNFKYPDYIKRYTCDVSGCDFFCLTPFHLNQHHLSRHDPQKQVVCTKCGKVYSQFYIETHTKMCQVDDQERRKYLCEFCVKSFMSKGNLFDHIKKVHTPSAHFNCEVCGDTIKTRSSLRLHLLSKHGIMSEGMNLHNCPMCDFKHPQLAAVKKHMESHLGGEPKKFVCTVCGNVYPTKGSLTRHAESHSDQVLQCDQCSYQTHSTTNLKSHQRIKHGGVVHTCVCGYQTQYTGGFNKHQKKCEVLLQTAHGNSQ